MNYDKDSIVFEPLPTYPRFVNLTHRVFTRLTVLGYAGRVKERHYWWCECCCGQIKKIAGKELANGDTRSCGCFKREQRTSHGMSRTAEYSAYSHAQDHCDNPNSQSYHRYGGRGLKFTFESFEQFYAEIGDRPSKKHSLDRIKNGRGYEPGNVRWATKKEQAHNRDTNRLLTVQGVTKNVVEWAIEQNVPPYLIYNRYSRKGFCEECSVILPLRGSCSHPRFSNRN